MLMSMGSGELVLPLGGPHHYSAGSGLGMGELAPYCSGHDRALIS